MLLAEQAYRTGLDEVEAVRRVATTAPSTTASFLGARRASAAWTIALSSRAARAGSGSANRSVITATASAPASIGSAALRRSIPPIATAGSPIARACRNSDSGARTACGLVGDANTLPNPTWSATPSIERARAGSS